MPMKDLGRKSDFAPEGEEPQVVYPSMSLSAEETEALGLGGVNAGQTLAMQAIIRVASVNDTTHKDESGFESVSREVTLEIREADVTPPQSSDEDRAERIFGSN